MARDWRCEPRETYRYRTMRSVVLPTFLESCYTMVSTQVPPYPFHTRMTPCYVLGMTN
jgi:hypothetical protein